MKFEYIDELINNCILAKEAVPFNKIIITGLEKLESNIAGIYIIEEIDGNPEKTFNDFSSYKSKKQRACPKLNSPSSVMYVGSSIKNLKSRLKQHIGNSEDKAHAKTYSLNLCHWFNGNYRITIKEYAVSPAVLQIIEDNISYNLRPAFGKIGGNNK